MTAEPVYLRDWDTAKGLYVCLSQHVPPGWEWTTKLDPALDPHWISQDTLDNVVVVCRRRDGVNPHVYKPPVSVCETCGLPKVDNVHVGKPPWMGGTS